MKITLLKIENDDLKKLENLNLNFDIDSDILAITTKKSKYANNEIFGYATMLKRVYFFVNMDKKVISFYSGDKNTINKILNTLNIKANSLNLPDCEIKANEKIKLLNPSSRYKVIVKSNKLKISDNKVFKFRPRFEIRQIENYVLKDINAQ